MGKNIYGLLNEMEMDFTEYEDFELSSAEKEAHKQRILWEIGRMENTTKKNTNKIKKWKMAAGAAAAFIVTIGAVGIANPILAKNMLSSVFGRLIETAQGEKYEEEYTNIYTKIGENAVDVKEETDKQEDKEEYATTVENNGVTISISDVYCDGYVLYYTASLKTDNEGLNQADGILQENKEGIVQQLKIEGMDFSGYSGKPFQKVQDGSFVAVNDINLMNQADGNGDFADLGLDNKTVVVDWTLTGLIGTLWDNWDEQGEYMQTGIVEGEWRLKFPVTVDCSANETYDINKEENGILVKNAVKTKAGLVLTIDFPDFRAEPYNDPYNDPDIGIKDDQGNYLQWLGQRFDMHEDGTSECQIMVLYDGQKDLSFAVTTKDEDCRLIADIGFQIP